MYPFVVFNKIYKSVRKIRNNTFHGVHYGLGIMNTIINKNIDLITTQNFSQVFMIVFILIEIMQFRHVVYKSSQVF